MVTKSSKSAKASSARKQAATKYSFQRLFPYILIIGSVIGIICATILTVEKIHLLKDPEAVLACDLNPVVACGSVINTPQASAFGFPNPLIGLVGFGIVLTVGMALLAGASFKRWFWQGLQAGTIFGVLFVTWLQYQSLYEIGALCPYCMVVWAVTIPIFVATTSYNLRNGHIGLPTQLKGVADIFKKYPTEIVITWYVVIFFAILERFWEYWVTLI